jgi:hypothetical protein
MSDIVPLNPGGRQIHGDDVGSCEAYYVVNLKRRTLGPVLMRVTMSKRHRAYVETAFSPCQFGIGRLARFNLISHKGNKGCRQSIRPLVPSLFLKLLGT